MDIDYKAKCLELTRKCKKHEDTISKLQSEIRQRCQSYLLYSSRNKKINALESEDLSLARSQIISTQSKPSLEESLIKSFQYTPEVKQFQEITIEKQEVKQVNITSPKPKPETFLITSQLNLFQEASPSHHPKKEDTQESKAMIIQSYKQRIGKINEEKTKYAKLAQKYQIDLREARRLNSMLEKKVQTLEKAEKKLKTNVAKIGQFQQKIHKIYKEIYYKLNFKEVIDSSQLTNFNQKLEFLLTLVSESSQALGRKQSMSSLSNDPKGLQNESSDSSDSEMSEDSSSERKERNPHSYRIEEKRQFNSANEIGKVLKFQISNSLGNVRMVENDNTEGEIEKKVIPEVKNDKEQREYQMKLEQVRNLFENQIEEIKKEHILEINKLNVRIRESQQQSKLIKIKQEEQHIGFQFKYSRLLREVEAKEKIIQSLNQQLQNAKDEASQNKIKMMENSIELEKYKNNLEHSQHLEDSYQKVKEELDRSRSIIDDLEHSKLNKEINDLKQISNKNKNNLSKSSCTDFSSKIVENLQEPYYVEEELYHDPNDEYVKRSFLRKKIVRRNLSATSYKVVSKSKEEIESIIKSRINNMCDKSLQKKQKLKESLMTAKDSVKINEPVSRISEVSAQNRESDYMGNENDEVNIVEVKTKTPKEEVSTIKIFSKNGEEVRAIRSKQK